MVTTADTGAPRAGGVPADVGPTVLELLRVAPPAG